MEEGDHWYSIHRKEGRGWDKILQEQFGMVIDTIWRQYGLEDILVDDGQAKLLIPRLYLAWEKTSVVHYWA